MSAGADNYMFRVSMVDREQVAGLMAYLKKNPAVKSVGYLAETTGYGQAGLKDVQEIGQMHGLKPACDEKFGVNDTDMTSQLNKCKAAGVDTIVVWAQGSPLGQLMRSMEKINYFPLTLMSWAADNQSFYESAGKALAERPIFMRTITEERTPRQQQLYDRVAAKLVSPSAFGFAGHSYDAVMLLAAAIKQAGSTEGAKVRAALENLDGTYEGVMKTYNKPFSKTEREALTAKDYRWAHWKDGKLVAFEDDVIKSLTDADFKHQEVEAPNAQALQQGERAGDSGKSQQESAILVALIQAIVSGLAVGGAYALIALGFSITFTTTKTLNFSHGDFVSVGAFVGITVLWLLLGKPLNSPLTDATLSVWYQLAAGLAAVVIIGLLGVLLYAIAVRPFAGKPGMSWVMSTIGFGIILTSLGLAIWGPSQVVVPSPVGDEIIRVFGVGIRPQEILMFFVAIIIMAVLDWVLRRTKVGKAMRAVAHDRRVASLMGIDVTAVMIGAFFLSSALAGLSGFLIAPIASASLYVGLSIALKGFSGAIIGGLSNPRGCVLGGFALGILEALVNLWQAQWREVVVFLIVILVLAFRPYGLLGQKSVEKV